MSENISTNSDDNLDITPEQREEVDRIFNDKDFLACMERGYGSHNNDFLKDRAGREVRMKRMKEALDAFSKLPDSFWAMDYLGFKNS